MSSKPPPFCPSNTRCSAVLYQQRICGIPRFSSELPRKAVGQREFDQSETITLKDIRGIGTHHAYLTSRSCVEKAV